MAVTLLQLADLNEVTDLLKSTGTSPAGLPIMAGKALGLTVDLGEHSPSLGNIVKQEALAVGADAAVHEKTSRCEIEKTKIVLVGTAKQLSVLARKLQKNVAALPQIGQELEQALIEKFPALTP